MKIIKWINWINFLRIIKFSRRCCVFCPCVFVLICLCKRNIKLCVLFYYLFIFLSMIVLHSVLFYVESANSCWYSFFDTVSCFYSIWVLMFLVEDCYQALTPNTISKPLYSHISGSSKPEMKWKIHFFQNIRNFIR